jgi:hypothetical protein
LARQAVAFSLVDDPVATAALVRDLLERQLLGVTEARHWYEGKRDDGAASLIHFWLHFQGKSPLMAHGTGEHLLLEFREPYASYDMLEHGEMRVGPAQAPDLLAMFVGQRLLDAALIQGYASEPSVGGLRLRFEREVLVVASLADEWVLSTGSIPTKLRPYLHAVPWLGGTPAEQPTEQPSRRTTADIDGPQAQVDEDQDHGDQQAATDW